MKKILCPLCGEIINVEDDKETIYCPKCFKNLSVEQGQKHLGLFVQKHFNLATSELYEATEYKKAAKDFQKVLDIIPDDFEAAEGLVLSTIMMSTIRSTHIKEAMHELQRYQDTLSISSVAIEKSGIFVKRVNEYLDQYHDVLKHRLMNKDNRFYEVKGEQIFKKVVQEIIDFKMVLIEAYFKSRKLPVKSNVTKEKLNKDIASLQKELTIDYAVESSPFHLLFTDVKECYIPDEVFKDVRKMFKNKTRVVVWNIISILIFLIGIVLIVALPSYLLIGVPITSIGLIMLIIFGSINISIQKKLSR